MVKRLSISKSLLIDQWDFDKNKDLNPDNITLGSDKKVWWKCKLGHSFQQKVNSRAKNIGGCPICYKESQTSFYEQALYFYLKQATTCKHRYSDLGFELDLFLPDLKIGIEYDGEYWHRNKTFEIKKNKCEELGMKFIAVEENYHLNCPSIDEEKNSITINANPSMNFSFIIEKICSFCRLPLIETDLKEDSISIYNNYIVSRKENNLLTQFPQIAKEWDYEKNLDLRPEMFYPKSGKNVWWKCEKGHSWKAAIDSRTKRGHNCPYCCNQKKLKGFNDLYSLNSDILVDWDFSKNKKRPENYAPNSNVYVWWKCHICGFEQQAVIANRTKGHRCRKCKSKIQYIYQYDLNFNLIKKWNNLAEIEIKTSYDIKAIRRCCYRNKKQHSTCGFIWSLEEM